MDFVQIGHGAVFFGHFDDLADGRDVAIHGIDGFKGNDLGCICGQGSQFAVQIFGVVMAPDYLAGAGMAYAFDH